MKAVVFHGVGDIRLDDVPEPTLQAPTDAIIRITASAICGTDLHLVRGTESEVEPGTILGHEAVGIVELIGPQVTTVGPGDRVVVTSSITCGTCENCRQGRYDLCLRANPNGPRVITAMFGATKEAGPFNGLQAEKARIPYADSVLVKLPDSISDEQAILLSDIFPAGYYGADLAQIKSGNVVAVFGCGPVGLLAILSAQLMGAGRIFAVDTIPSRLEVAQALGAEVINFDKEDPVKTIKKLTGKIGADRVIDAVGVDANRPHHGLHQLKSMIVETVMKKGEGEKPTAPEANPQGDNWHPGDAPTRALVWEVEAVDKGGTLAIIGVYPKTVQEFPLGLAMNKNISILAGHVPHRKYIPHLIDLISRGEVDPTRILTEKEPLLSAIDAYKAFDERQQGWLKVELVPSL
jgi:threonine dehydrogenase-like Zn-dependent dehydrogenase